MAAKSMKEIPKRKLCKEIKGKLQLACVVSDNNFYFLLKKRLQKLFLNFVGKLRITF